jgi:hypothetical protein
MICPGCGKEAGNLYCGHCREIIKEHSITVNHKELIPVLYFDKSTKLYHPACNVTGCPCNTEGVCMTGDLFIELLKKKLHEYDGDNCVQQGCG